ncbi:MAG: hypothetical protein QNJ85_11645 [Gammaproteobacteria bacterium]|nr:hypothetical protein [Gammaproteobacteria bacterium]
MKKLTTNIARLLCVALLLAPWSLAQALDTFQQAGMISGTEYEKITIKGRDYRPDSEIEVVSDDPSRSEFGAFRKGDVVYVEGKVVNGTRYVDVLRYDSPDSH